MSWVGVTSMKDNVGGGLGQGTDNTEGTDMDSNLQDIHLEGDVEHQAVSIGEVGAPTRFRHIKNNKYMRRLYLVLAALAAIFVLSSLLRLSIKSNNDDGNQGSPTGSSGSNNSSNNNNDGGMDMDLSDASIRESHLLVLLHDVAVDEAERKDLLNAASPQRRALHWLADVDPMNIEIPETRFDSSYPAFLQRYSSAVLAYAWSGAATTDGDADGGDNNRLAPLGFLSGKKECEWNADYQRPDGSIFKQGLICNPNQDHVIKVVLQTLGLTGSIPRELGNLHSVSHMHLDGNKIVGHLPQTMRRLSALREFTVTRNQLSGHLPPFLAKMKSLRHAELSKNQFSGHISYAFGVLGNDEETSDAAPSPLRVLALDHNKFNGPLDSLKPLITLEELYLNNNGLTGHIDKTFHNHSQLAIIDANNNKLSGKVPDYLLALPSMVILDFHSNQLAGQLPHGNATTLKYLDLRDNAIVSKIPKSFGQHPNLAYLDLSENQLQGQLIEEFGQLKNLQYLFLSNNPTLDAAPIPEWIQQLPILTSISLKATARVGPIPEWLGNLKHLSLLDLESNALNGTIPERLSEAEGLQYLFLNRNELEGSVPEKMGNLTNLILFNLDHNSGLNGAVPSSVCQLPKLSVLNADCGTSDAFPKAQIECSCCTKCCVAADQVCNSRDWTKRYGKDWGGYYERYNIIEDGDVFEIVADQDEDGDGGDN